VSEPTPPDIPAAEPADDVAPGAPNRCHDVLLAVLVVGGVYVLDQLTKVWAVRVLADGPIDLIGTTVQFLLAYNTGSAFSLFQGFTPLLAVLAVGITVVLVRMLARTRDRWMVLGLSLVLAGALGNLTDRIVRADGFLDGAVVDFVKVGWWPVFNVADSAITIWVIVIVVRSFRRS
jgi:signal peptidase II